LSELANFLSNISKHALVSVLYRIPGLYHNSSTVDWTRWRHKITGQRGPAPRSCIGPLAQVLHWAPHLLGPALDTAVHNWQNIRLRVENTLITASEQFITAKSGWADVLLNTSSRA